MADAKSSTSVHKRRRSPLTPWGLAVVAALLIARAPLLVHRLYDPDELEHVHVSVCVARGLTPYRDFFEHHGPAPYLLGGAVAKLMGPSLALLTAHRVLSLAFVALTAAGAWRLSRAIAGADAAAIGLAWLFTLPIFVEKSVEWRPDAPALCLLTWGAVASRAAVGRSRWGVGAGALLALATLCTLKVAFLVVGIVVAAAGIARSRRRPIAAPIAWGFAGFVAVWLIAVAGFASQGALADFLRCVIAYPLGWGTRTIYLGPLVAPAGGAPAHWGMAILGLAWGLRQMSRKRAWRRGDPLLALPIAIHLATIPLLPAVYLQHVMLGLGFWAGLVGAGVDRCWKIGEPRLGARPARWATLLPIGVGVALAGIDAVVVVSTGRSLASLAIGGPGWRLGVVEIGALVGIATGALLGLWRPLVGRTAIWLALLAPAAVAFYIYHGVWSNAEQRRAIEWTLLAVPPDGKVLDGYTGYGALRPHAFYWWWINEHTLPLLEREGALPELVRLIDAGEPAVVLYDRHLARLAPILEPALAARYQVVARSPGLAILWRDDLVAATNVTRGPAPEPSTAPRAPPLKFPPSAP